MSSSTMLQSKPYWINPSSDAKSGRCGHPLETPEVEIIHLPSTGIIQRRLCHQHPLIIGAFDMRGWSGAAIAEVVASRCLVIITPIFIFVVEGISRSSVARVVAIIAFGERVVDPPMMTRALVIGIR